MRQIFGGGICPASSESFWNHFSFKESALSIAEFFLIQESALNHPNHFGIIFDSGPARIIRIILASCLIRAWIQDPRSKIPGRSSQRILDPVLARIHPNHFGIIFDSGLDPRSKIPGRSSQGILDPVLARIIQIILESCLIRAGIQDPRSKIAQESLPGILDLGSQPESKMIPK